MHCWSFTIWFYWKSRRRGATSAAPPLSPACSISNNVCHAPDVYRTCLSYDERPLLIDHINLQEPSRPHAKRVYNAPCCPVLHNTAATSLEHRARCQRVCQNLMVFLTADKECSGLRMSRMACTRSSHLYCSCPELTGVVQSLSDTCSNKANRPSNLAFRSSQCSCFPSFFHNFDLFE